MRILTDHIAHGDQAHQLEIAVLDKPGAGGANHCYHISGYDASRNTSRPDQQDPADDNKTIILFQKGGIKEEGINGITNEGLLAIVADRLRGFMKGPYPSQETAAALANVEAALDALKERTIARIERGVEGQQVA